MAKRKPAQTLNVALRPQTFADVIGLEREVAAINNLLLKGKLPRAFLLAGPFGCGKTTLAYLIARQVSGADERAMNIQEVNAASVTGIDDMRALIDRSYLAPFEGNYNVLILDEAHKLSKPAQEALLKVLEEPNQPTIWILCTTDKDKLAEGIRAGRCFTLTVRGLDERARQKLVERAAKSTKHEGDLTEFLGALTRAKIISPRKILMAFDAFHAGLPVVEAIGAMHQETLPEYWEICMGVVFGYWDKPYTLSWVPNKNFKGVGEQLRLLDDRLKRKPSTDTDGDLDDEDLQGRPEVAQALRTITAATLKGQVMRNKKSAKAAEALVVLGNCAGLNGYGMEFSLVVGALFRVHQIMKG